ncbi:MULTISPECIES: acyl-CoA thioester hydrolase YciA [Actinobacillus]|uniref:Acyl-CoA thioester hydrolase YciA n=7 Tax=Actinobacillus TaxID=713 RepID=A0A223MHF3_ACTPL|nr:MULTISPECIES: acyl-CoA thioester hydrolase YciA [Actinobacillus]ABN74065.1 putative acyl CoA thioester hydrolase [Actinobacillus pleuropneumoniae serovar 5b str. L20]ABY69548.1 putative acyl CoA thioester hydrolase [Actinobacillus pleuropneumoniae serovar 3 str. JL03]ACE61678.1 putative acyl CoA thioester hydrolase [Actinobacillus pleuropneumoniae serovar 7 str. AP76]ASU16988.1 putative acyl-CoA thioester hydrolase [Actinobacillus pleuropneumoniae]AWG95410.1 acyl-CoA thioester hydrolase Yci
MSKHKPYDRNPNGKLLLRTLAMPSDTNANGDIFGGWIMSQMDLGGAILAKELAKGRVVTVTVDKMVFHMPISVGDVVCCYGTLVRVGRSSMQVKVEVFIKQVYQGSRERFRVTEALFTYVAVNNEGRPREIPRENNPELDEALSLMEQALAFEAELANQQQTA